MYPISWLILKFGLFGLLAGLTRVIRIETFDDLFELALGDANEVPVQKIVVYLVLFVFFLHLTLGSSSEHGWISLAVITFGVFLGEILSDSLPDFMDYEFREEAYSYSWAENSRRDFDFEPFWGHDSSKTYKMPPLNKKQASGAMQLKTLKLEPGVSLKNAKTQYRKLARKYHPDIVMANGGSAADVKRAKTKMQAINSAYEWCKENLI